MTGALGLHRWYVVLAAIVAVKAILLLLDSTIRVYLGDSVAYLYGALDDGRLPDDRSFTYSFIIRTLVYPFEQLSLLAPWQTLAGIATAVVLWHLLRRRVGVGPAAAFAAAGLFAMEPAQLYYERMVLAETFGLLAFALFFAACAAYLASRRIRWLAIAILLGLVAVTLRLNYLPVVLVVSVVLPILPAFNRRGPTVRSLIGHVAAGVLGVAVLHAAYCAWVGYIFGVPPAYLGRAGFMQLGLVMPLVKPEHLVQVGLPPDFERQLKFPLADPDARMRHLWTAGGLVRELRQRQLDVEGIARQLSRLAILDDPLGIIPLGLHTVSDYFREEEIQSALYNDLGRRAIPPETLWSLREKWHYDASHLPTSHTVVSRYFEIGTWWLVGCLLLLVPLSATNIMVHWSTPYRLQALLAGMVGIGLVLAHVLFVPVAFYRYLHPLPFFVLLNAVPLLTRRKHATNASPVERCRGDSSDLNAAAVPRSSSG